MKRFFHTLAYALGAHVLILLLLSFYRVLEFGILRGMMSSHGDAPVLTAFIKGVWFDNVIACYIMIVPLALLLLAATMGWYPKALRRFAGIWWGVLYAVVMGISASNIPYFAYFFKNIDASIFGWFGYAGTTAGMLVGERSYLIYFLLFLLSVAVMVWCLRKWRRLADRRIAAAPQRSGWGWLSLRFLLTVIVLALCVFGIRGRRGYNPIKISQAYYCNDPFLNQLGIAPAFNLFTSTLDGMRKENAELHLMPYGEAISYVRKELGLTSPVDSTSLLRRQVVSDSTAMRPNVVIILMESMSASLMQTFGQKERLTPTLDSLYRCSLAFTRFYSAGIHTNHGITATLYSFPALMMRNLMKGTVTPRRTGLATVLKSQGYHNLFFMTHESQYDNMNAFLRTNGYDDVYAQEDYPSEAVVNSFGVPDQFLFDYALPVINKTAASGQPFMATLLTISNHPPYIISDSQQYRSGKPETQIVEYADKCIGDFLAEARRQPWYANTVFVILADHGKLVGEMDSELPQSYNHIPCIMFGPGIQPALYDGLGMQVDVMPTLLGVMGLDYEYEGFGLDLLKTRRDKVFYTSDTQLVARDSTACLIHDPRMQKDFCYEVTEDGQLKQAAAGQQVRYDALRRYVFAMEQTAEYMQRHP